MGAFGDIRLVGTITARYLGSFLQEYGPMPSWANQKCLTFGTLKIAGD